MNSTLNGYPAELADQNVIAAPWEYNPSAWIQRIPICILAFFGFLLATHLSLYQWRLIPYAWDPLFGDQSEKVLDSNIARMMDRWIGVPDAALGAIAYLGDAIFGLAGSTRRWQYRPWLVILFGIDVIPLGLVSAILVICQCLMGSLCFICLVTAVISLILVYMAYDEVYSSLRLLYLVKRDTQGWRPVWTTLWGYPSQAADEIAATMARHST